MFVYVCSLANIIQESNSPSSKKSSGLFLLDILLAN